MLATGPAAKHPPWAFHYYGPHQAHVREMALKFGIQDKVILPGKVSREAALSAIAGAGLPRSHVGIDGRSAEEKGVITGKIPEAIGIRTPLLVVAPAGSDVEGSLRRQASAAASPPIKPPE